MSVCRFLLPVLGAGLMAAGCVAQPGDFGRARPNDINDTILPAIGQFTASRRWEPRSDLPFTDPEKNLRNRSWAIVMPNGPRPEFERILVELRRTRVIPARWTGFDRASYAIRLSREKFSSTSARYHYLRQDIEQDRILLRTFFANAQEVMAADLARERALGQIEIISPREREDAMARIAENRIVIWWTHHALKERIASYTYALERLMIDAPDRAAIATEQSLLALQADLAAVGPFGPAVGTVPATIISK